MHPSIFIFKSGIGCFQFNKGDTVFLKTVINLTGRMLIDGAAHSAAYGGAEGIPRGVPGLYGQTVVSLTDDDFILPNAHSLCP